LRGRDNVGALAEFDVADAGSCTADIRGRDHRHRGTAAASVIVMPGARGGAGAGLACLMIAIAAVDARRFIIPDELSAAALALGLVHAAIRHPDGIGEALALAALRAGVVAAAFLGLWALYRRPRGREGIGLGDVKLAGVAGSSPEPGSTGRAFPSASKSRHWRSAW
jgi:hypothetical protein